MEIDARTIRRANANDSKKSRGQFFTRANPFRHAAFRTWAAQAGLPNENVLEPFAGANHLIDSLRLEGLCNRFRAYDIEPAHPQVVLLDTLKDFPTGHRVCVTNPPWLGKNSATRRGYAYPSDKYDDLYKHCLELCLRNCDYVAALIPASFLQSNLFFERLQSCILLQRTLFTDTDNPVCLALFSDQLFTPIDLYNDHEHIGTLAQLQKFLPRPKSCNTLAGEKVRFNDPKGALGFISFDNTKAPSIRFCHAEQLKDYEIKESSRFITRIDCDFRGAELEKIVARLNRRIDSFRANTHDVFLTPFKGIRQDGKYRRRMKFSLARSFIHAL